MSCGSELVRNDPLFISNTPLDLELWCSEGLSGTNLSMSFADLSDEISAASGVPMTKFRVVRGAEMLTFLAGLKVERGHPAAARRHRH